LKRLNGTETKALLILSIVAPVGLLAAFRLTGILEEPITISESITVEAVSWSTSRPAETREPYMILIDRRGVVNSYTDGKVSFSLNAWAITYFEKWVGAPFEGADGLVMRLINVLNVSEGFIDSFVVRFSQTGDSAFVDLLEDPDMMDLYGVKLVEVHDWLKESYIESYGIDQPKHCRMEVQLYWVFLDAQNSVQQSMTINLEATYFNGTAYRKLIVPILLKVYNSEA